jgi:SAM-dependent methyltransferase
VHPSVKPALKSVFRAVKAVLPAALRPHLQSLAERAVFRFTGEVHDLPAIFHYWSNRYLRPQFEALGFSGPDAFFTTQLLALSAQRPRTSPPLRILALGCGRADLELALALALRAAGHEFKLHGIDLTLHTVKDARNKAATLGLAAQCSFEQADLNRWLAIRPAGTQQFDVVLANHCLHHVLNLEQLFAQVKACLASSNGVFLVADMIGRNGHMLWPETLSEVATFWAQLPARQRLDRATGKYEAAYVNYDCSQIGYEGIRAQDILPLLLDSFAFELFLPYGGIVIPLIERRSGWNFDVNSMADLAFVDRLAAREHELSRDLRIKPTQMLAVMRPQRTKDCVLLAPNWTPAACVRQAD